MRLGSYKDPDFQQRQSSAATAKKSMLERFRAASEDPGVGERQAERAAVHEARQKRMTEREAAKKAREAEKAAEAARAAEVALEAEREAEKLKASLEADEAEREFLLAAEQKAARDARYAARKAAKKQRRKG
jgi:hypothetical protein